jgi:hypothetical protein
MMKPMIHETDVVPMPGPEGQSGGTVKQQCQAIVF